MEALQIIKQLFNGHHLSPSELRQAKNLVESLSVEICNREQGDIMHPLSALEKLYKSEFVEGHNNTALVEALKTLQSFGRLKKEH